ncbi:flagellar basal body rod protein FlgC [Fodinibius halophilus]|uniref:Flagellar basal body rod protein FlgC n=1 Tax=Fodinibius halophilus TaxID=1736908 RepID=A0A6M1SV02_9BACT|nr:flagellar basal body rod C-terminal domain-containing protein [Fodinibius halophilus]NGP87406.1 flagellar basal body rod protein FlgC [Fodinibius halophilus]
MLPDRISTAFQTAAQGLSMQRERINVASRNIANINSSSTKNGASYRPQTVRARGPEPTNFKNVLRNSVSSMRKTDGRHLSAAMPSRQQQTPQGLGPSYEVAESNSFRSEYDPQHPDADKDGMVQYPDIDMIEQMTNMVSANRLYEANLSSIEAEKQIMKRSMRI